MNKLIIRQTSKFIYQISHNQITAFFQMNHIRMISIHPSIFFRLSGLGRGDSCLSRDTQTSLTLDTSPSSSRRIPRRSQANRVT